MQDFHSPKFSLFVGNVKPRRIKMNEEKRPEGTIVKLHRCEDKMCRILHCIDCGANLADACSEAGNTCPPCWEKTLERCRKFGENIAESHEKALLEALGVDKPSAPNEPEGPCKYPISKREIQRILAMCNHDVSGDLLNLIYNVAQNHFHAAPKGEK